MWQSKWPVSAVKAAMHGKAAAASAGDLHLVLGARDAGLVDTAACSVADGSEPATGCATAVRLHCNTTQ